MGDLQTDIYWCYGLEMFYTDLSFFLFFFFGLLDIIVTCPSTEELLILLIHMNSQVIIIELSIT